MPADAEPKLDDEIAAFVLGGVALSVATRDDDLRPAFTRAWGLQLSADRRSLSLCVIAPPWSATHANLESNGAIAITCSPPTIARAVQLKGVATEVRDPRREELDGAERHLAAFCEETEKIGYPAALARRLYRPDDFVCVVLAIGEVFEQTPGPSAGRRL